MDKLKIIAIILIVVFLTIITVILGSNDSALHKQVVFGGAGYVLVDENPVSSKDVKTTEVAIKPQVQTVKTTVQTNSVQQAPKIINQNVVKQQQVKVSNTSQPASNQKVKTTSVTTKNAQQKVQTTNKTTQKVATKTTAVTTQTQKKQEPTKKEQAPVVKPKVKEVPVVLQKVEQKTDVVKIVEQPITKKKVLTESEEIVVWNKWHSDLQNQVMRDTKIGAPQGTVFRFSFTVDKFGNMSNIKVWSDNPVYTDLAVRVIKPILNSYQKKPILKFPEGTKRTITNAKGGFAISTKTEYSTPQMYNDVEKVKTTQYK